MAGPQKSLAVGRLTATALLVWLFFAPPAHAREPGPLELRWQASGECPEKQAVVQAIERHLADAPRRSSRERVTAHVRVRKESEQWLAQLYLRGAVAGERVFKAASCRELAEVVSLVIALALQAEPPRSVEEKQPEPVAPEPPEEPEPSARDAPGFDRGPSTPAASPDPRLALGVLGLVDSAALSRVAAGVAAEGLLDLGHVQALVLLGYFPPVSTGVHERAVASFDLGFSRVQGCYVPWLAAPRAGVCAALEGGALGAKSEGLGQSKETTMLWVAAGTGIAASLPIGPWLLRGEAGLLWPLRRPRFVVDEQNELHEVANLGYRAALGLFVTL